MIDRSEPSKGTSDQLDDELCALLDDERWSDLKISEVIFLLERQTFVYKARCFGYKQAKAEL